jgi:hypothetical protein
MNSFGKWAKHPLKCLSMSDPYGNVVLDRKKETMNKDLATLQAEYDLMVKIAMESDYDLDPQFEKELTNLMRLIKSLGGNVR